MKTKIALIGSAPSSVRLAPYQSSEWAIWACSPGSYPIVGSERVFQHGDAFFEMHRWEPPVVGQADKQVPWFTPEYVQWLAQFQGPVYMESVVRDVPNSVRYPVEPMIDKYGPYFFNSTLSYMFALALQQPGLKEIGLWGVDMSATEEWGGQRLGCHYFVTRACEQGVEITVPPESDLLMPKPLYGVGESTPMMVKLTARKRELQNRLAHAQQRMQGTQQEIAFLQGALDDLEYMFQTWTASELLSRMVPQMPAQTVAPHPELVRKMPPPAKRKRKDKVSV